MFTRYLLRCFFKLVFCHALPVSYWNNRDGGPALLQFFHEYGNKHGSAAETNEEMFLFIFLVYCCRTTEGEVTVKPGQDVVLQCQNPTGGAVDLLEWIRPDLEKDSYVFFYRDGRSYKSYQHAVFRGRVELRDVDMKDGDVSVILRNVSNGDTGTYECHITVSNMEGGVRTKSEVSQRVSLVVTESAGQSLDRGQEDGGREAAGNKKTHVTVVAASVSAVVVLCLVVVVVAAVFRKRK